MDRPTNLFFSPQGSGKPSQQHTAVSWSFVASVLGLSIVTALIFAGFFWYLSFGFDKSQPRSVAIQGLAAPAEIAWYENGSAAIKSDQLAASLTALGYVHAIQNPWQMMLWRQTSMGELSAWFGPSMLRLDRLNKQLRFARIAEETFTQLAPEQKALLEAYALGINEAINERNLLSHNDFAFLDTDINSWKAWHTLSVERLFTWLTVDFNPPDSLAETNLAVVLADLKDSDYLLHKFLQIYGFEHSVAGSWRASDANNSDYFYQRIVYGASANPLVLEVKLTLGASTEKLVGTIPGTLSFLSSQSQDDSWAILPASAVDIRERPSNIQPSIAHQRITNRNGTEILAAFQHFPGFIAAEHAVADTANMPLGFYWDGLEPGTDTFAFLDMLQGKPASFHLLEGHGLRTKGRQNEVLGTPLIQDTLTHGIMVGSRPWTSYLASHIDSLNTNAPELLNPRLWSNACHSPWAAERAPFLLAGLFQDVSRDSSNFQVQLYQEAITYLRNWDFGYAPSSIGATIFEFWLDHLGAATESERLNMPNQFDSGVLGITFRTSIDGLNENYGTDLSQWRLEVTRPVLRYFPAWAADSLFSADRTPLSETNYAPLEFPGKASVETLCSGSFRTATYGPISAYWETWRTTRDDKTAWYWRKQVTPVSFLERYLISNRPNVEARLLPEDKYARLTRLTPIQ